MGPRTRAALCPDPRRLYDAERFGEGGVNPEMGRVELDRVVGWAQRRGGAPGVAGVAADDVGQNRLVVGLFAAPDQFERAALRPRRRAGGDEDLHVCFRTDDRADVPAVEDRAAWPGCERALRLDERRANAGHRRNDGRSLAHLACAQRRIVEIAEAQSPRSRNRRGFVVKVAVVSDEGGRDRAVKQPGIEMRQPVMRRNPARDRAFTRGRGAVDGDDHREPPASPGSLPSAALLDRGEAAVEAGTGPLDMTTPGREDVRSK